ncbi:MAG TPA: orotidine-5'-phosphate decarboxylase [Bacillota bacterium]|nr:orotidine-5'-phosphate decarboxylase [Bacillota bacterium]
MEANDRLILALDVDTMEEAERLVAATKDYVGVYKVGMQLYNSVGPAVIHRLKQLGHKVFADLKFHDIPNTVKQAGEVMTGHGVYMFNVHCAGGREMMRQTTEGAKAAAARTGEAAPLLLGVTILTSLDQAAVNEEVGLAGAVADQVVRYARLAQESGLDGVVASPKEIGALRQACGEDFALVIPGIRPAWAAANDQKRIMTPGEAIAAGATYIVVGRPITAAADPREAAAKVVAEIVAAMQ